MSVAIASILENTQEQISFFIFDGGITDQQKKKVAGMLKKYPHAHIEYLKITNEVLDRLPLVDKHLSLTAYHRLFAATYIPNYVDRLIYLDCDTVTIGNIKELYELPFEDQYFAACLDGNCKYHEKRTGVKNYINSGVMLINLKLWREQNVEQKFIDYMLKDDAILGFPDQDVLNIVANGKIKILDPSWNYQTTGRRHSYLAGFDRDDTKKNIFHFLVRKPWRFHCRSPYQGYYYKYLLKTPWAYQYPYYWICKFIKGIYFRQDLKEHDSIYTILWMPLLKKIETEQDHKKVLITSLCGIPIKKQEL